MAIDLREKNHPFPNGAEQTSTIYHSRSILRYSRFGVVISPSYLSIPTHLDVRHLLFSNRLFQAAVEVVCGKLAVLQMGNPKIVYVQSLLSEESQTCLVLQRLACLAVDEWSPTRPTDET